MGHRPPVATAAIRAQLERDLTFGAQHDLEYEVAEMFTSVVPCADQVCFANSGTEIVQVALRLARAVTGRVKYLKFEGHYHGWDDSVLVSYKSSREELEAAGMTPVGTAMGQRPDPVAVVAEWNNEESVRRVFAEYPGAISAVICEPLLANNGCVEAAPGFLEMLRAVTRAEGALLIFDEVITGFRLGGGGGLRGDAGPGDVREGDRGGDGVERAGRAAGVHGFDCGRAGGACGFAERESGVAGGGEGGDGVSGGSGE